MRRGRRTAKQKIAGRQRLLLKIRDFNFTWDRSALFRDRPTNVFQVKGTYWIGR